MIPMHTHSCTSSEVWIWALKAKDTQSNKTQHGAEGVVGVGWSLWVTGGAEGVEREPGWVWYVADIDVVHRHSILLNGGWA